MMVNLGLYQCDKVTYIIVKSEKDVLVIDLHSFLPLDVCSLKPAPLWRLLLPRLAKPASCCTQ